MMHRIKRSAPQYLLDLIPGTRHELTNRLLRNYNNISLPSNRLSSFKNSFFPDTIRRWNRLEEEIKLIECNRTFKKAVARRFALTTPPLYYSFGHKTDNIFHTRLRLGLSSLNADLFKINAPDVESPCCKCKETPETVKHYFFFCPLYAPQRDELEKSLMNVLACYNELALTEKLAVLLHGCNLDKAAALAVAACVQRFIRETKRFGSSA